MPMSAHCIASGTAAGKSRGNLLPNNPVSRTLLLISLLIATSCVMLAWTWRAWPDAVVDFGREVYVPWRLYEGDTLYSDVAYFNGPLSPHVNPCVFRILGPWLDSLFIANFLFHLAVGGLIFAIVRFITNARCGLFCLFVFELLFAYGQYLRVGNYNFMAPYSHELTHGILLSLASLLCARYWITTRKLYWSLIGGVAVGLVFLTKPEIFLAVALAWMMTLGSDGPATELFLADCRARRNSAVRERGLRLHGGRWLAAQLSSVASCVLPCIRRLGVCF